jgi:hypothetical protein
MAYIMTGDKIKSQLKQLNRNYQGRQTWNELYGSINFAEQQGLANAASSYESNILNAYSEAYRNRASIANSALGSGYKQALTADLDYALSQAYDSYRQNYLSQVSQVKDNSATAISALDDELTTYSNNMAKYQNSMYTYLQDLYNRAYGLENYKELGTDKILANKFEQDPLWQRYIDTQYQYQLDEQGNIMLDDKGNAIIAKDDAGNPITNATLIKEQDLYSMLYDNDKLTEKGIDFYDQMLNSLGVELGEDYGFNAYLNKTDSKLYEWSQQASVYDYNKAGTNLGTFKQLMGLESDDYTYSYIERKGGLTKEKINAHIADLGSNLEKILNTGDNENTDKLLAEYDTIANNLKSTITELALDSQTKDALLKAINEFSNSVMSAKSGVINTLGYSAAEDASYAFRQNKMRADNTWALEDATLVEKLFGSTSNYALGAIDATVTFMSGVLNDVIDTFVPNFGYEFTDAVSKSLGDSTRQERHSSRISNNKQLVSDIEAKYLDLIAYLSKYA